jgi:hypothetical protein
MMAAGKSGFVLPVDLTFRQPTGTGGALITAGCDREPLPAWAVPSGGSIGD